MNANRPEHAAIAAVLDRYAEGARRGAADITASAFHPEATIRGKLHGAPVDRSRDEFVDFVASHPARGLRTELAMLDVAGEAAVARLECYDWNGVRYTDLFTLIRRDGAWRIVSKVFHAYADA